MKTSLLVTLLFIACATQAVAAENFPPGWLPLSMLDDKPTWSEVREIKARIQAEADRDRTIILANANRTSQILRGEGEAEAEGAVAGAGVVEGRSGHFTTAGRKIRGLGIYGCE